MDYKEQKRVDEALWESEKRYQMKRRVDNILKIYMLLGGIGTIFGMAYFILTMLEINFSDTQLVALLIAGISFALTIASYGMLLIRKERLIYDVEVKNNLDTASDFLRYWAKFENASKDALEKENRKYNKYSIREILELLYEEKKIDKSDLMSLEEAIQIRNSLVHKGDTISPERAKKYINLLTDVIHKVMPL